VIEAFALPGLEDVWQIPDVITPHHFFDNQRVLHSRYCAYVLEANAINWMI
jgi:hypothetical protein